MLRFDLDSYKVILVPGPSLHLFFGVSFGFPAAFDPVADIGPGDAPFAHEAFEGTKGGPAFLIAGSEHAREFVTRFQSLFCSESAM